MILLMEIPPLVLAFVNNFKHHLEMVPHNVPVYTAFRTDHYAHISLFGSKAIEALSLTCPGLQRMELCLGVQEVNVAVHGTYNQVHVSIATQIIGQHHAVGILSKVYLVNACTLAIDDVHVAVMGHHYDVQTIMRIRVIFVHFCEGIVEVDEQSRRINSPSSFDWKMIQRISCFAINRPDMSRAGAHHQIQSPISIDVPE
mmetsp:Transcript_82653/g.138183  ORF Transcript_82653/g.138183 Transcript_82653/m.138183 type:complete len:200 (-) Transcript_82653:766-1365(-)